VALPAKLNTRCDLPFNSSSELTGLTQNDGWGVSGGQAVSTGTTASGTSRRYMMMSCATWSGVVDADMTVGDQKGLVVSAPSTGFDGGTGVYFGIFFDSRTGSYYFKLWNEYAKNGGATRSKFANDCDGWVEQRCKFAAGTVITVKLGTRNDGWYVQINGKESLWLKTLARTGTFTAGTRTGVRAGAWATVAGATIDRLKVSESSKREFPTARTTMFYDTFDRANAPYDSSLANTPYPGYAVGSASWNLLSSQLSMPASTGGGFFPADTDAPDMTAWGVVYYATFQYISGGADLGMLGTVSLAVCTATPGSQVGLALGASAGKGGTSWTSTYDTVALASGTWVQVRVCVPYNNALAGAVPPYGTGTTEVRVYTGTSAAGPWTERVSLTALPTASWSGGSASPSAAGPFVIDEYKFERGPITDIFPAGSWPVEYDYGMAPGDFVAGNGNDTEGRPGLIYVGADFLSRTVESG